RLPPPAGARGNRPAPASRPGPGGRTRSAGPPPASGKTTAIPSGVVPLAMRLVRRMTVRGDVVRRSGRPAAARRAVADAGTARAAGAAVLPAGPAVVAARGGRG